MGSGFIFGGFAVLVACGQASDKPDKAGDLQPPPVVTPVAPLRLELADCNTPEAAPSTPSPVVSGSLLDDAKHAAPMTVTQGSLDKDLIRRAIRRELPRLQHCYEQQLAKIPKLHGTVNETFVIGSEGTVTSSSARGLDPVVASCVDGVVKTLVFPRPSGGTVTVTYPFDFITTGTDTDSDTGKEHAAAAMPIAPTEHVAGASSPLASVRQAIEGCVRQAKVERGSIMLALVFGTTNDATITVEGTTSPALATCLTAIKIARAPGAPASQRCSFSFGP